MRGSIIVSILFWSLFFSPRFEFFPIRLYDILLTLISLIGFTKPNFRKYLKFPIVVFCLPYTLTFFMGDVGYLDKFIIFVKYFQFALAYGVGAIYSKEIIKLFNGSEILIIISLTALYFSFQLLGIIPQSDLLGVSSAVHYGICTIGECAVFQTAAISLLFLLVIYFNLLSSKEKLKSAFFLILIAIIIISILNIQSRAIIFGVTGSILLVGLNRNPILIFLSLLTALFLFYFFAELNKIFDGSRYSYDLIISSIMVRVDDYYSPAFNRDWLSFLIGSGYLSGRNFFPGDDGEVHNYFLRVWLEGGVLGLILFVFFIIRQNISLNKIKYLDIFGGVVKIYGFVMLLSAFFQDTYYSTLPMYLFMMLTGAAYHRKFNFIRNG